MKKIILSGGGTGGHIYPAIAIADELKKRLPDTEFLFVGASDRMEMQRVPQAGYPIKGLQIAGIQRKLSLKNLLLPFKLLKSLYQARQIIKEFQPDAVIGTGGYASAPTLKAAQWLGVPYFVQEQNSYAGITNQWVGKKANKIFVAYQNMEKFFPKTKISITGNPIRAGLANIQDKNKTSLKAFSLKENIFTLLVLGGSLGAKSINELINNNLSFFEENNIQIIWQCGKFYYEAYKNKQTAQVQIRPFIENMEEAYAVADVIISRAGASSVSELCVVGKPVIFIPSPNVAEDHQTKNAQAIADKNAAILLKENELEEKFQTTFLEILKNDEKRKQLSENIKSLAKPNATSQIVDEILKIIG
ncbi:MAG: undecaprenyldiphospho-muramoylpentapeptide beta-N-acetylglucosaminyltransferase [Capnocytophaga sp.]|nr:undecaprenyldiphospho-muramoylpentapeptide beta-N-acetylglucosaminyltransferase [Capnocytophaga sp.]